MWNNKLWLEIRNLLSWSLWRTGCTLRRGMNQHSSRNSIKRNCGSSLKGSSENSWFRPAKCLLLFPYSRFRSIFSFQHLSLYSFSFVIRAILIRMRKQCNLLVNYLCKLLRTGGVNLKSVPLSRSTPRLQPGQGDWGPGSWSAVITHPSPTHSHTAPPLHVFSGSGSS